MNVLIITWVNCIGNSTDDIRAVRICCNRGMICWRSVSVAGSKFVLISAIRLGRKFTEPRVSASTASVTGKFGTRASSSFSRANWANESDVWRINRARSSRIFWISFYNQSIIGGGKNRTSDLYLTYGDFFTVSSPFNNR